MSETEPDDFSEKGLNPEAYEESCVWGEDCRKERAGFCPPNCIWVHEVNEHHPRCFGFHMGSGLLGPEQPDGSIARKHCSACDFVEECLAEHQKRFGLSTGA